MSLLTNIIMLVSGLSLFVASKLLIFPIVYSSLIANP